MKRDTLPEPLKAVPSAVLEHFLGAQIASFANGLANSLESRGFNIPRDTYKDSAREVFQLLMNAHAASTKPAKALQLVFRHDCMALGCILPACRLCKHNPSRRCGLNFDKKYLVNDVLKAKCQAVIRVEVVEAETNQPVNVSELAGREMLLQMAILDGNAYDNKHEAGLESEYESCLLFTNNKGSPTLVGTGAVNDAQGFTCVPLTGSRIVLPDLRVTDSSEAMLSGRKPPLRLMMRAVYKDTLQPVPNIRHAISEGFVVAVEIPSVDDHVSKLEHMGRETVKKLADLREAAVQAGVDDLEIPNASGGTICIETVGAFRQLAMLAESSPPLQKRLMQILKLSREKWEEARDHAAKAVVVDNRMRIWWSPSSHMGTRQGLVVPCTKGTPDMEHPIALIEVDGKATFAGDWTPHHVDVVRRLQPLALQDWWQPKHVNWDLLDWDSEVYKARGELVVAQAQMEGNTAAAHHLDGSQAGPSSSSRLPRNGAAAADIMSNGAGMQHPGRVGSAAQALAQHAGHHHGVLGGLDDGRAKSRRMHGAEAMHEVHEMGSGHHASGGGEHGLVEMRSSEILDVFPGIGTRQDTSGAPRILSGTFESTDPYRHLTMSQNLSGLDTMQSIEQALPQDDGVDR